MKLFLNGISTSLLLLIADNSVGQVKNITYGNLDTNRITVQEFKAQNKVNVPAHFIVDSISSYFSIPGSNYIVVPYFPVFDSIEFNRYRDLLMPGAIVSFQVFYREKNKNGHDSATVSYVFYGMQKSNIVVAPSTSYNEWKRLRELNYTSGTIYFSGECFSNVVTFYVKGGNIEDLKKYFDSSCPGTSITFDNVTFNNDKNKTTGLNRTFKLD